MSLPALSTIAEAVLRHKDGGTIKAKQLWEGGQAAFIYCVRRPGW